MILQYCSDLHLEFKENQEYLAKHPLRPVGNILLLAGDIVPFLVMHQHAAFFDYLSDHFQAVYWLPGNHEYYGSDAKERSGIVVERIRENIFLVNNFTLKLGSVRLIFSTLWSDITPLRRRHIEQNVNDFHAIKFHKQLFNAAISNHFHNEAMEFLRVELAKPHAGKTVVVSHFVPTLTHYPLKYRDSMLNEAFAVELRDFIGSSPIDHWIYGHHHCNVPDFRIGRTSMRTNQLGYVEYAEHGGFWGDRIVIV